MRRVVLGCAGAVVAIGVALGALAARTPPGAIETELRNAIRDGSGLVVAARGPVSFALFPTPNIRLEDVKISDVSGVEIATIRALTATPRLKALIAGRVEIDEITLKTPTLPVDALDLDPLAARLARLQDGRARMPSLRILEGVVTWRGGRVESIDAGVAWPRVGRALALTGAGRFRGRTVEFAATVDDPIAAARGERSGIKAKVSGGGARLAFEGATSDASGARRLEGTLGARVDDLKEIARWFGSAVPALGAPLADVTLSGRAVIDRSGVAVEGAELAVDGANFIGVARFGLRDGRPDVEATLDARELDVTRYLDGFEPTLGAGGWSATPLDVRPFRALDLDLRLSAREVKAGPLRLGPTAATVTVANGALDVAVGEAAAYGGALSGRVVIEPDGRSARVRLQLQALDVDVGDALTDGFGAAPLSGALSGDASLEGRGATIAEIVRDLAGRGSARLEGGTIGGFRARALNLLGLGGKLDVQSAEASVTVTRGVARTEDLALVGPAASLRLAGDADLSARRLSLGGSLAVAEGRLGAPVSVEGPFTDPKLRLRARAPERRSEAPAAEPEKASAGP